MTSIAMSAAMSASAAGGALSLMMTSGQSTVTSLGISAAMSASVVGGAAAKSAKAAVAVSPSVVSAVLSGEEEAARVVAADAVDIVVCVWCHRLQVAKKR